jgi:hypothetical protein
MGVVPDILEIGQVKKTNWKDYCILLDELDSQGLSKSIAYYMYRSDTNSCIHGF